MKTQPHSKPYLTVGAEAISGTLWKQTASATVRYRFTLFRVNAATNQVSQRFRPQDLRSLTKVIQLLAIELLQDGWLEPELRQQLRALADQLDPILPFTE